MAIGPIVRRLFGRHEHKVADLYRSIYIDLDAFVGQIGSWVPQARSILEVGCGEGAVTELLARAYPDAQILGIDISPNAGRLYRGPRDRVRFAACPIEEIADASPGAFDLVILSDVIHHVPLAARASLLASIKRAMASDARFVFKEWERSAAPIFWMGYAADRWLTGDDVSYLDRTGVRDLIDASFGPGRIVQEARIKPWNTNLAFLIGA